MLNCVQLLLWKAAVACFLITWELIKPLLYTFHLRDVELLATVDERSLGETIEGTDFSNNLLGLQYWCLFHKKTLAWYKYIYITPQTEIMFCSCHVFAILQTQSLSYSLISIDEICAYTKWNCKWQTETMATAKEIQVSGEFSWKFNKRFHCSYAAHTRIRSRKESFSSLRASAGFPKSKMKAIWGEKKILTWLIQGTVRHFAHKQELINLKAWSSLMLGFYWVTRVLCTLQWLHCLFQ